MSGPGLSKSEVTHILGIDPGVTTGVAFLDVKSGDVLEVRAIRDGHMELVAIIDQIMVAFPNTYVVIEDFVGCGRRSASIIYTLKLVGWLQTYCKWRGYNGGMQQPQRRRSWLPDAKVMIKAKRLKNVAHTRDALAHCLAYRAAIL